MTSTFQVQHLTKENINIAVDDIIKNIIDTNKEVERYPSFIHLDPIVDRNVVRKFIINSRKSSTSYQTLIKKDTKKNS